MKTTFIGIMSNSSFSEAMCIIQPNPFEKCSLIKLVRGHRQNRLKRKPQEELDFEIGYQNPILLLFAVFVCIVLGLLICVHLLFDWDDYSAAFVQHCSSFDKFLANNYMIYELDGKRQNFSAVW